jgi:hypothetical protein
MVGKLKYKKYVEKLQYETIMLIGDNSSMGKQTRPPLVMDERFMPACTMHMEVFVFTSATKRLRFWFDGSLAKDCKSVFAEDDDTSMLDHSPMYHNYREIYLYNGTNPDDPKDLGGEVELWLGCGDQAEKYMINEPTCVYIPPGLMHTASIVRRIDRPDRPIIHTIFFDAPRLSNQHVRLLPPELEREAMGKEEGGYVNV